MSDSFRSSVFALVAGNPKLGARTGTHCQLSALELVIGATSKLGQKQPLDGLTD